jgi:hypothetical protein
MPSPGDVYFVYFSTANPSTGAAQNADSTPTLIMSHNGTDDNTVTFTVTHLATGRYSANATIPSTYVEGDSFAVWVDATVASVAGTYPIAQEILDAVPFAPFTLSFYMSLAGNSGPAVNVAVSATVSIDAAAPVATTNVPVWVSGGQYKILLATVDQTCQDNAYYTFSATGCDISVWEQIAQ